MRCSLFLFFLIVSLPCFSFDHSHSEFNQLLNTTVVEKGFQTSVDYDQLKENLEKLDRYLANIEAVTKLDFDKWNKKQQMAFLINAYNAFTLKLILNNYPEIKSIRDLGGLIISSPWDKKFFTLFGEKSSLGYIEHDLLRENYNEPRIHFAVNCASKGCPALQKKAFVGNKLDQQLEYATIQFMRDPERNRYNSEKKRIEISSIFKWFGGDFTKSGSLQNFIATYISDDPEVQKLLKDDPKFSNNASDIQNSLRQSKIGIIYLDYDWSLNKR
jgi:Protein of unknown function, DUF547